MAVTQVLLRDALLADLPQIVAIYNATIPARMSTADTEPVTVEQRKEWFSAHSPGRYPIWVLEDEGEVRAWLSLSRYHARAGYSKTVEVSVYVAPAARRRGLARLLLDEAIRRAPELGFRNLLGLIFSHNAPSIRLFESKGFVRWGELPGVAELDGLERSVSFYGRRVS